LKWKDFSIFLEKDFTDLQGIKEAKAKLRWDSIKAARPMRFFPALMRNPEVV
jgi:hypothetical protein